MSNATNPSVLQLERSVQSSTDNASLDTSAAKAELEKYLQQFETFKQTHSKRLEELEHEYTEEIKKIHEIFKNLGEELDKFKNHIKTNIDNVTALQTEQSQRIDHLEQLISTVNSNNDVAELREELVEGIRLLGKRVSKAVEDMNKRFEEFKNNIPQPASTAVNNNPSDVQFASIKERPILDNESFEIVTKGQITRLSQLFQKQSQGLKHFIEEQHRKMKDFEKLIKVYDEENNKLIEMLNRKSKRNLLISLIGMGILVVLLFIFQFVI